MTEAQIKHMVDRFLGWRLPKDFSPDAGIVYMRPNYAPEIDATPSGTNLFDATQADAMVRYMLKGLPPPPPPGTRWMRRRGMGRLVKNSPVSVPPSPKLPGERCHSHTISH